MGTTHRITTDQVTVERHSTGKGHELRVMANGEQAARVAGKRAAQAAALIVCYGETWNSDGQQVVGYWGARADAAAAEREADKLAARADYRQPGAWVAALPVIDV